MLLACTGVNVNVSVEFRGQIAHQFGSDIRVHGLGIKRTSGVNIGCQPHAHDAVHFRSMPKIRTISRWTCGRCVRSLHAVVMCRHDVRIVLDLLVRCTNIEEFLMSLSHFLRQPLVLIVLMGRLQSIRRLSYGQCGPHQARIQT